MKNFLISLGNNLRRVLSVLSILIMVMSAVDAVLRAQEKDTKGAIEYTVLALINGISAVVYALMADDEEEDLFEDAELELD